MSRNNTSIILFLLFTFFMLYVGLWSELAGRIKFNQWDIIGTGAKGRVTNHNLYSNFYLIGLALIMVIVFFRKALKILNYIKKNVCTNLRFMLLF